MRVQTLFLSAVTLFAVSSSTALSAKIKPTPGRIFRDCRGCPEMVVIPPGRFVMGAPASENGTSPIEQPVHPVTVRAFASGRYDITRAEYATFVHATRRPTIAGCAFTGRPGPLVDPKGSWLSLGFPQTGRHPVVCITWKDAKDYAAWLSKRTGKHYRLLTEAEWEYAARSGTSTPYYWGSRADRAHLNYGPERGYGKGVASGRDKWLYTSPVGSFPANGFELYDMSGNVLQFVEDCLGTYDSTPRDGSAYTINVPLSLGPDFGPLNGTMSCAYRIARGGDWGDAPDETRAAFRNFAPDPQSTLATYRSGGLGFRVARDLSR